MPDVEQKISKKLILTDYGRKRVLENITPKGYSSAPFRLTHVCFGNKLNVSYDTSISDVGRIAKRVDITNDNIIVKDGVCEIVIDVDGNEGNITEIGVYETLVSGGNISNLFAYVGGLQVQEVPKGLSFSLLLKIDLKMSFKEVEKDIIVKNPEYAHASTLTNIYNDLSRVQIDLERCIQMNARRLGFNKPNVYYNKQLKLSEYLSTFLLMNKYTKVIDKFNDEITDYFIFPAMSTDSYIIRNLKDNDSNIKVSNTMYNANKDNIDFERATSIVFTGKIKSMAKHGIIFAKSDPANDNCYFELKITSDDVTDPTQENYLKFCAYSYDIELEQKLTQSTTEEQFENESKLLGEYSISYWINRDKEVLKRVLNKECTFTIVFNGSELNPKFDFYINDILINSEDKMFGDNVYTVVSNYNYLKPPSFVDYNDKICYDVISDDYIYITKKGKDGLPLNQLPDFDSALESDDFEVIDLDDLKFFGIFEDLLRDNEIVSNYIRSNGTFTEDNIQTTNSIVDPEFLRSYKIIGDIYWRNYNIRYNYYKKMKERCTLKNYNMFMSTILLEETTGKVNANAAIEPKYYLLDTVDVSLIITFSKALSAQEVKYIANVNKG